MDMVQSLSIKDSSWIEVQTLDYPAQSSFFPQSWPWYGDGILSPWKQSDKVRFTVPQCTTVQITLQWTDGHLETCTKSAAERRKTVLQGWSKHGFHPTHCACHAQMDPDAVCSQEKGCNSSKAEQLSKHKNIIFMESNQPIHKSVCCHHELQEKHSHFLFSCIWVFK